jgi:mRNA interferase RelE/StbE
VYRVELETAAEKRLAKIAAPWKASILRDILGLEDNPRPPGCKLLKGDKHSGWRIRIGKYRVLYTIDDEQLQVVLYDIELRDKAYRRTD